MFPFMKYFHHIERYEHMAKVPISLNDFVSYLKTASGYNCYVEKEGKKPGFKDPTVEFEETVTKHLKEYTTRKNVAIKEKPILMRMPFFLLILKKAVIPKLLKWERK